MASAGSVKAINKRVVHQICSGQVVLNLATAVKELIENSLDAGATVIEIRLRDYGSDQLEVIDNASGIEASNFEALTLKHHTSKLQDFSDLSNVATFGFRGEALSSLCALSDLIITTCHKSQSVGTKIEYDHNGAIKKQSPCPRQQGTTVLLQNLFYTLPVRHKEFLRNVKKEFTKMVQLLQAYCIISNGVKITCTNQVGKGKKTPVIITHGNTSTKENIINIFGPKQLQNVLELEQVCPDTEISEEYGLKTTQSNQDLFRISGYISKPDHRDGRSSTDRQFYFINKRPCDFPKVSKLVNEVYHMYNRNQFPFVVMDISLAKESVDVNLTPDKRKILVQEEKTLLAIIKTSLQKMFAPRASMYHINQQIPSASASSPGNLAAMFGRGPKTSDDSPTPPRQKLTLAGLKRSFSASGENANTDSSREAKQPKLDTFFLKKSKSDPTEMDSISSPSQSTSSQASYTPHDSNSQLTLSSQESKLYEDDEESPVDSSYSSGSANSQLGNHQYTIPSSVTSQAGNKQCSIPDSTLSQEGNFRCSTPSASPSLIDISSTSQSTCNTNSKTDKSRTIMEMSESDKAYKLTSQESGERNEEASKEAMSVQQVLESEREIKTDVMSVQQVSESEGGIKTNVEFLGGQNRLLADGIMEPGQQNRHDTREVKAATKKLQKYKTDCVQDVSFMKKNVTIPFSMTGIKKRRGQHQQKDTASDDIEHNFRAKIKPTDNTAAEDELKKVFTKDSFTKMDIIGQFNLGFIIAKLKSDLFIIDQHATDEKYNFEDLQKNTVLQSQRLIQPMKLELTAVNEMILRDNLDIFRKNGFEFVFDDEAPPTERVKLTSLPVSKNWTFGKDDVDEMIFMLSDAPGTMCRPSRIRQMFASRACRKSIMIGTALNKSEMTKLVNHMADLDQPWNCPHGRPTFRHLFNLNLLPDD
ncbi:mismatch repair endonuclease PMS2-like [Amphiura filiformis]|uniref:mismatch repair endonuclease PMS2-like n=1 Tax=Amphiura filiformis TaxID=82378 RepID=UPI003B21EB0D